MFDRLRSWFGSEVGECLEEGGSAHAEEELEDDVGSMDYFQSDEELPIDQLRDGTLEPEVFLEDAEIFKWEEVRGMCEERSNSPVSPWVGVVC